MKNLVIIIGVFAIYISMTFFQSCATQSAIVSEKSGAILWAENCVRCHNTPSPAAYNDTDWETIGMHMRIRANLTKVEIDKVVDFLKSAN